MRRGVSVDAWRAGDRCDRGEKENWNRKFKKKKEEVNDRADRGIVSDRSAPINSVGSTVVFILYFRFLYNTHTIEPKRKSRL